MPTMAATGNALRIQLCSDALNPRPGRYAKISGYHAPQMKNSSTIIRNSLDFADRCIKFKLETQKSKPKTGDRFLPCVVAYDSTRQTESCRSNIQISATGVVVVLCVGDGVLPGLNL